MAASECLAFVPLNIDVEVSHTIDLLFDLITKGHPLNGDVDLWQRMKKIYKKSIYTSMTVPFTLSVPLLKHRENQS